MQSRRSGLVVVVVTFASVTSLIGAMRVDPHEARRFVGREDDVRVDAQLITPNLRPNGTVSVVFEIQNFRNEPIALDPSATSSEYDEQTGTATVIVGAEIPDAKKPNRLVVVNSGEKKSFTTAARLSMPLSAAVAAHRQPQLVQVKVNYLGDVKPFAALIASNGAKAGDALFPQWVENNVAVVTNSVPFDIAATPASVTDAEQRRPAAGSY